MYCASFSITFGHGLKNAEYLTKTMEAMTALSMNQHGPKYVRMQVDVST